MTHLLWHITQFLLEAMWNKGFQGLLQIDNCVI
jgi:hypothetical protein